MHNCFLYGRQGHTSRGPVTVWPRTGDSGADFGDREPLRVRGGYVAGPWRLRCRSGKCLGTGDGRVHEGPKSVAGPGGKCGPGTVWPETWDGRAHEGPKSVAGPGGKCGPGPVRPGTGDGMAGDLGRQSARRAEKRCRSRREMRTGDGMVGDRGRERTLGVLR